MNIMPLTHTSIISSKELSNMEHLGKLSNEIKGQREKLPWIVLIVVELRSSTDGGDNATMIGGGGGGNRKNGEISYLSLRFRDIT